MDHVRTPSDVAFRSTHSGSPALRPFHGLWPRLGCCSPLAVRPRPFHGLWPRLGCCAPLAARRRLVASPRRRRWWGAARRSPFACPPSMVSDLGRGVAFAAPLAPGRAARSAAVAGLCCVSPSPTPPSATWAAAALLILTAPMLHRMVWRDADTGDDARSFRRGPDPRAHRAVWPRGRLAGVRPWGLPLGVGARPRVGRLGTRSEGGDQSVPGGHRRSYTS